MINAARNNNIKELQRLLATGDNINSKDRYGYTALMWAAYSGHAAVAQCLLTAGSDLEAKDKLGHTALRWAAQNGHVAVVQCLVTAGAELEAKDKWGMTALMCASYEGHVAVGQFLLAAGAELEAKDNSDKTAFMRATQNGYLAMAQYLVYSGKPWATSMQRQPNDNAAIAGLDQCSRIDGSETDIFLTGVRGNIVSLKAMLLGEGAAVLDANPYPERINVLAARISGVVFQKEFTQRLSGMSMPKFMAVSSLMRSAKLTKIVNGCNEYLSMRILMQATLDNIMLSKLPDALTPSVFSFTLGKESAALVMQEMPYAVLAASIASPDPSPASFEVTGPGPSKAARVTHFGL